MVLKVNKAVRSLKAQNKVVTPWLPQRNSDACQVITDFVKYLLGRTSPQAPYPLSPDPTELAQLPELTPESIISNLRILDIEDPATNHLVQTEISLPRQTPCWSKHKQQFLSDLAFHKIPRFTFAWEDSYMSRWNQIMICFIIKHWQLAKEHNAFSQYRINPKHGSLAIARGVIERWLRGRKVEGSRSMDQKKNNKQQNAVSLFTKLYSTLPIHKLFMTDCSRYMVTVKIHWKNCS